MLSTEHLNRTPVMSKKRGNTFRANVMDVPAAPHEKDYEVERSSLIVSFQINLILLKSNKLFYFVCFLLHLLDYGRYKLHI